MTDETVVTDPTEITPPVTEGATRADPLNATKADPNSAMTNGYLQAAPHAHESLLQRIEHAIESIGSPAHALDWIKQEIARFRAG
jgi:hypothetical protein